MCPVLSLHLNIPLPASLIFTWITIKEAPVLALPTSLNDAPKVFTCEPIMTSATTSCPPSDAWRTFPLPDVSDITPPTASRRFPPQLAEVSAMILPSPPDNARAKSDTRTFQPQASDIFNCAAVTSIALTTALDGEMPKNCNPSPVLLKSMCSSEDGATLVSDRACPEAPVTFTYSMVAERPLGPESAVSPKLIPSVETSASVIP